MDTTLPLPTFLITEKEAAERLHLVPETLRKWRMYRPCIPFVRVGARIMYRPEAIDDFINEHTVMP